MQEKQPVEIKSVQLANGAIEVDELIIGTMLSLRDLITSNPKAFYELVSKCRDANHRFYGNTEESLIQAGLVQKPGEIHDSTRNIVLSAVKGEGLKMTLGSPFPAPQDPQ